MTRFALLARRLVLLFGFAAGCADETAISVAPPPAGLSPPGASSGAVAPPGAAPTSPQIIEEVERNLARLRALEVMGVGRLVLDLPAEAYRCYGPCVSDPAVASEYGRQAPRLAQLTEMAAQLAGSPELPVVKPDAVEPDLAALRNLKVVEITGLLTVVPAASPNCYKLPCPADVERAEAENQRRASVVHALAARSSADKL